MENTLCLTDCGVDWITVTTPKKRSMEKLYALYRLLRENQSQVDYVEKEWRFSGYRGFHCGSMNFGVRYDGAILQLSGMQAQQNWRKAYALAKTVTRIDYQLTSYSDELASARIGRAFKEVRKWSRQADNRCSVKLISGPLGPETVYVGSRTSHSYGRIYDKGLESGLEGWANHVRHEVEFKGEIARTAAAHLSFQRDPNLTCAMQCSRWFAVRGHSLPIKPDECVYRQPRVQTDVERRLEWLRIQVSPFVKERRASRDLPRVFEALGIDEETVAEWFSQKELDQSTQRKAG